MILVVEPDPSFAGRIRDALEADGWPVTVATDRDSAGSRVARQKPHLALIDANIAGARELLGVFARQRGGPGAVVLIPAALGGTVTAADFGADELLTKPFSDEDLRSTVRRALSSSPQQRRADGNQLTAADIFGDVLAEVEAQTHDGDWLPSPSQNEMAKRPAAPSEPTTRAAAPTPRQVAPEPPAPTSPEPILPPPPPTDPPATAPPPRLDTPLPAPSPPRPTSESPPGPPTPSAPPAPPAAATTPPAPPRPAATTRARRDDDDIERKLEETLSGLFAEDLAARAKPGRAKTTDATRAKPNRERDDVDALLDRTLASLELPSKGRPQPKPTPRVDSAPAVPPTPATPTEDTDVSASPTPESPAMPAAPEPPATPEFPAPPEPPAEALTPSTAPHPSDDASGADLGDRPGLPDFAPPDWGFEPPPTLDVPSLDTEAPFEASAATLESTADDEIVLDLDAPALYPDLVPPSTRSEETGFVPIDAPRDELDFTDGGGLTSPDDDDFSFLAPSTPAVTDDSLLGTNELPALGGTNDQEFGEYTLLERIAVGGMAEVWKARRRGVEGFQKDVAIKKILGHLTDNGDFVTMFIDEAKLAAQLHHNNIVQIYDLGKTGDDYYIAMEFVDGRDLRSILNTGRRAHQPLTAGMALMIAARLARALDYAHHKLDFEDQELGLVHRDVSPQNVLISYEGDIKLCDFGIVKAVTKASTTQMGALKGKLQYMSPEQAWGRDVDGRSDIFSLGTVLYEMLTGTKAFAADSELGVLEVVRECRFPTPRSLQPEITAAVEAIVLKAMAAEPSTRYQTAGDLADDLETVLAATTPLPKPIDLAAYVQQLFLGTVRVRRSGEMPAPPPEMWAEPDSVELGAPARGDVETPAPTSEPSDTGTGTGWSSLLDSDPASSDTRTDTTQTTDLATDAAYQPVDGTTPSREGKSRLPGLILAVILLILIAATLWYFLSGNESSAPPSSEPAPAASSPAAGDPEGEDPVETPTSTASEPTASGPTASGQTASDQPATATSQPADASLPDDAASSAETEDQPTTDESPAEAGADLDADEIEKRLEEEMARRAEALREEYRQRTEELQRDLDAAQQEAEATEEPPPAEPDDDEDGDGGGG
ncbi:MAG: protein kinase [Acidobacteriota bacterium]